MATLSQHQSSGNTKSLGRGTTQRNLGGTTPIKPVATTPKPSAIQQFGDKLSSIGGSTLKAAPAIATKVGSYVKNVAVDVANDFRGTADLIAPRTRNAINESMRLQMEAGMTKLTDEYKAGKVSKKDYTERIKDYSAAASQLNKNADQTAERLDLKARASDAAWTAVDVLSVGGASILIKPAIKTGARNVVQANATREVKEKMLKSVISGQSTKLDKVIQKIPAMRDLVYRDALKLGTREAQKLAGESVGQFITREGKNIAIGLLLKRPIVYQMNVEGAQDVYDHLMSDHYNAAVRQAAFLATQMVSGGPLGIIGKGFHNISVGTKKLTMGQGSFIDELSKRTGTGTGTQVVDYLTEMKNTNIAEYRRAERVFRVLQETNMRMANENTVEAANRALQHWEDAGIDLRNVTPKKMVDLAENWVAAHELKNSLIRAGKIRGIKTTDADRYVVVRWDVDARNALADRLEAAGDDIQAVVDELDAWRLAPANAAGQNDILMRKIEGLVNKHLAADGGGVKALAESIRKISAVSVMPKGIQDDVKKRFAKLGFAIAQPFNHGQKITPAVDYNDTRKLITTVQLQKTTTTVRNPELDNYDPAIIRQAKESQTFDEFLKKHIATRSKNDDSYFNAETEISQTNRILENKDTVAGGEKIGDYYRRAKGEDWYITEMTPDEYLDRAARAMGASDLKHWRGAHTGNVEEYAAAMKRGDKFPMPWVNEVAGSQEGRTRALAAKAAGQKKIPVAVAEKYSPERHAQRLKDEADVAHNKGLLAILEGKKAPAVNEAELRRAYQAAKNPTITRVSDPSQTFDIAQMPQVQMGYIGNLLGKAGLSTSGSTTESTRILSQHVVANLADANVAKSLGFTARPNADTVDAGRVILNKLQQYIENRKPNKILNTLVANTAPGPAAHDIRQLTSKEIAEALTISNSQARAVRSAIVKGYTEVPLEYRGLGDKLVDMTYRINPVFHWYTRAQSAFRYTYNPFFRTQEAVETRILSRAQARTLVWNKSMNDLDADAAILDKAGIFKTGLSGEAAQDLIIGRITANLTQGQKRNLAGLAGVMAKQRGISLEEMVTQHSDEVADALRVIVQYPNRGILNSSLARTLNIAFFPMRYNLKVTSLAADILSREPAPVQLAVINSLFTMRDWLKSDEGIRWQGEHADALQVLKWATPVGSIEYVMSRLTHAPDAPGELGSLGGLPFGVISQMLDSQGIITLNTPYVNPETGDVFPRYIPETTKAKAATAIQDLLGSMFTYPGRVVGLPGKQQTLNTLVREFIATNGADFDKRLDTDRLTPLQQNMVRVLKGDTSDEALDALYNAPAEGEFNWYTIPPLTLPLATFDKEAPQVKERQGLPTKKQLSDAKKAQKKQKNIAQPIR